jgi:hypothetical protein
MASSQNKRHLPGCKLIPFRQIAEEMGDDPPLSDDWYDRGGIESCVDGCPHLEAAKAMGRELAKELGW